MVRFLCINAVGVCNLEVKQFHLWFTAKNVHINGLWFGTGEGVSEQYCCGDSSVAFVHLLVKYFHLKFTAKDAYINSLWGWGLTALLRRWFGCLYMDTLRLEKTSKRCLQKIANSVPGSLNSLSCFKSFEEVVISEEQSFPTYQKE